MHLGFSVLALAVVMAVAVAVQTVVQVVACVFSEDGNGMNRRKKRWEAKC